MDASKILGLAIELELKTSECYQKLSLLAEDEHLKDNSRNSPRRRSFTPTCSEREEPSVHPRRED